MQRVWVFTLLLVLAIAVIPVSAQLYKFDNSGGGLWKEYMSFPINTTVNTYAQYKIEINGITWKIYNAEGDLKISGTNNNFWNLVNPNGSDIRVFNDTGTQLYFWIEKWDYVNKKAIIWVNLSVGSTELNIAYGNPCATESTYNNATKTFEFFDDFETWSGWTNYGSGVVSQSSAVAYHGTYSLKKDLYRDPNGGYKPLGKTVGRDVVLEFWVDRTYLSGADADRIGLIDNNGNGYGWGYGVSDPDTLWIDIRSAYSPTSVASINPSVNIATNQWYRGKLIIKSDGTIIAKVYTNDSEESLGGVTSTTDTSYNTFTRVYVFGGYTYYVDLIKLYKDADPANFGIPVIKQFGKLLEKGLTTNVTYLSKSLPADTLYVNVTYLDTGSVSSYNPIMTYIPYGNTFNASASISITGVNATVGANITIKLDANKTLTVVIYNNTDVTANLTSLGTEIINGKTYNIWNLTVYENGTLTIYALTDPIVDTYKGITLIRDFNVKDLTCTFVTNVTGVDPIYGANITFKLNNHLTLVKVIYNNTDVTANVTYIGNETIAGETYNIYSLTVYEDGNLNISASITNIGLDTIFKLDKETVNISTVPAIIGEDFDIELPWIGNVTIAKKMTYTNISNVSVNTKDLGIGTFEVIIFIEDTNNWKFGYLLKNLNITYGRLNVTIKGMNSEPFGEAVASSYNERYKFVTTDFNKLWAGWQRIDVYFHDVKLKSIRFYLNHSTTGANITIEVNATKIKDYRGVDRIIASPNSFEVVNLSADYPYSVIKICNYSGTVIIDYSINPPTAVEVTGAQSYVYTKPILKIYGSGNATITDLYKLTVSFKDRLGNPLNFYITLDGQKLTASKGLVYKLLKPSKHVISFPTCVNGFQIWSAYPDNGHGGTWTNVTKIKCDKMLTKPAVYKIVIDGDTWSIYNYNDTLKLQFNNTNFWNVTKKDGNDIRILDQTGRQLYFYIDQWDYANHRAVIYVKLDAGTSEILVLYGNKLAEKSMYNNPSKVFLFYDGFEVWNGWDKYGSGVVSQSSDVAFKGKYSLKKGSYLDPNGGYKDIGRVIGRNVVLEAWIYRDAYSYADRIGLIDDSGNGYGFAYDHGVSKKVYVDVRNAFTVTTTVGNPASDLFNVWYKAVLIITKDKVIAKMYKADGTLNGIAVLNDSTYKRFTKVYVFGGYTYHVDEMRIYSASDPVNFTNASVGSLKLENITVETISDVSLPAIEYRVPTSFKTEEIRIAKFQLPIPIPFLQPEQDEGGVIVRLTGTLRDYYNAPLDHRNITIEISTPKYTRIYNITTDESGNFMLEVAMAKGIEYTVKYIYNGDDVYVGTISTSKFYVEKLPSTPPVPAPSEALAIVIAVIAVGTVVGIAVFLKRRAKQMKSSLIDEQFRFFRRFE